MLARRVSVDEHTIELTGSPVFYRRAPSDMSSRGEPLYLHDVPTSSDDWLAFLERAGGIAPDLPGFGRTGKAANLDYTLEGHARFVERLLGHLDVDRVALVAHGWGAGGGLVFAQRHAHRVERLVLIDPLPLLEGFDWHRAARLLRRPGVGELLMGATTRRLLARVLRKGGALDDRRLDAIWRQFDQGTQRAVLRLHRATGERELAEAGAGLARLAVPALVIWGEEDPWFPAELAGAYGGALPDCRVELIAGAGHWPWLDQPRVIERVASFLGAR